MAQCASISLSEVRALTNDDPQWRLTANRFVARAGDHWRVTVTLGPESGLAAKVAGVDVVALLGTSERTSILSDEARWLGASDEVMAGIATTVEAGGFALDGVCRQGSDRHVDAPGGYSLLPVIPTPTPGVGQIQPYSLGRLLSAR